MARGPEPPLRLPLQDDGSAFLFGATSCRKSAVVGTWQEMPVLLSHIPDIAMVPYASTIPESESANYVCVCVYIYMYIHVCMHVCTYMYTYLYVCMYICTYIYIYICICVGITPARLGLVKRQMFGCGLWDNRTSLRCDNLRISSLSELGVVMNPMFVRDTESLGMQVILPILELNVCKQNLFRAVWSCRQWVWKDLRQIKGPWLRYILNL